jgi:hypothetical protein
MIPTLTPDRQRRLRDTQAIVLLLIITLFMTAICALSLKWPLEDSWTLQSTDHTTTIAVVASLLVCAWPPIADRLLGKRIAAKRRTAPNETSSEQDLAFALWPLRNVLRVMPFQLVALFDILAFLMEERMYSFVAFVGVVIAIVYYFPTRRRFDVWSKSITVASEAKRPSGDLNG